MAQHQYSSRRAGCGCVLLAMFTTVVAFGAVLASVLGDCGFNVEQCHPSTTRHVATALWALLAVNVAIGALMWRYAMRNKPPEG